MVVGLLTLNAAPAPPLPRRSIGCVDEIVAFWKFLALATAAEAAADAWIPAVTLEVATRRDSAGNGAVKLVGGASEARDARPCARAV